MSELGLNRLIRLPGFKNHVNPLIRLIPVQTIALATGADTGQCLRPSSRMSVWRPLVSGNAQNKLFLDRFFPLT